MNKRLLLTSMISAILLTGCSVINGVYYPDSHEMEKNLEKLGYSVSVTKKLDVDCECNGRYLTAEKNGEFIYFYWLEDAEPAAGLNERFVNNFGGYDRIDCVTWGNDDSSCAVVYIATEQAWVDSGIHNTAKKNENQ